MASDKATSVLLSGWGRYPQKECSVITPATFADAATLSKKTDSRLLARGNGRSYGDASLGAELTLDMRKLNRFLAFNDQTGDLTCEAGVFLSDIVETFIPRGWFPPVSPGTKYVTIAGMIASDVHGKNHHVAGSFCDHVTSFRLAIGDGQILTCSRTENADLFRATCGGMGLTGLVLDLSFRMLPIKTSRIVKNVQKAENLSKAIEIFESSSSDRTYSVAWIDCLASGADLGRSAIFFGEHASPDELPPEGRSSPFDLPKQRSLRLLTDLPVATLNKLTVSLFNAVYYRRQKHGSSIVDIEPYFYPLDAIADWNRMYGRAGFVQYQCVLPLETSHDGLRELLKEISKTGQASFLAVLKRMGDASFGDLSFPMKGYTLALDFPATAITFGLLDRLDEVVSAAGGRIYFAKDARMSPRMVETGYPRLEHFRTVRRQYGLDKRFSSALSNRLEL